MSVYDELRKVRKLKDELLTAQKTAITLKVKNNIIAKKIQKLLDETTTNEIALEDAYRANS